MERFEITIDIGGVEVEVRGNYAYGCEGDYYNADESDELEVIAVMQNDRSLAFDKTKFTEAHGEKIWQEIESL